MVAFVTQFGAERVDHAHAIVVRQRLEMLDHDAQCARALLRCVELQRAGLFDSEVRNVEVHASRIRKASMQAVPPEGAIGSIRVRGWYEQRGGQAVSAQCGPCDFEKVAIRVVEGNEHRAPWELAAAGGGLEHVLESHDVVVAGQKVQVALKLVRRCADQAWIQVPIARAFGDPMIGEHSQHGSTIPWFTREPSASHRIGGVYARAVRARFSVWNGERFDEARCCLHRSKSFSTMILP